MPRVIMVHDSLEYVIAEDLGGDRKGRNVQAVTRTAMCSGKAGFQALEDGGGKSDRRVEFGCSGGCGQ
jgi:hypothetical protein